MKKGNSHDKKINEYSPIKERSSKAESTLNEDYYEKAREWEEGFKKYHEDLERW